MSNGQQINNLLGSQIILEPEALENAGYENYLVVEGSGGTTGKFYVLPDGQVIGQAPSDANVSSVFDYEYFENNNAPEGNVDAFQFLTDKSQVSSYREKARKISFERPEILGFVEFKPLYTRSVQPQNANTSNNLSEPYDFSNQNLKKSPGYDLFKAQAHLRIAIQEIVESIIKGSVSYQIEEVMKKISFSVENKKIFDSVPYDPPFPINFKNSTICDYVEEKDASLAQELRTYGEDKYLNLIFQYFLCSVFSDKVFKTIKNLIPDQSIDARIEVVEEYTPAEYADNFQGVVVNTPSYSGFFPRIIVPEGEIIGGDVSIPDSFIPDNILPEDKAELATSVLGLETRFAAEELIDTGQYTSPVESINTSKLFEYEAAEIAQQFGYYDSNGAGVAYNAALIQTQLASSGKMTTTYGTGANYSQGANYGQGYSVSAEEQQGLDALGITTSLVVTATYKAF